MSESKTATKFVSAPLLWSAAAFAVGIAAAKPFAPGLSVLAAAAAASAAVAILFIEKRASSAAILLCFAVIGGICFQLETTNVRPDRLSVLLDSGAIPADTPLEIEGRLADKPESAHNGVFLLVDVGKGSFRNRELEVSGALRIFVLTPTDESIDDMRRLDLRYGSLIRVVCVPDRDGRYMNPGVMPRREILRMQGADASATLKSPLLIEKIAVDGESAPLTFIFDHRQGLIEEFRRHFSASTAGVMIASILGNKYFLDRETAEVFREGGTFHILVISGLHITFIGGLALLFVRMFTKDRRWQFIAACSFLWVYTIAVGAETPVLRASVMFTVIMASRVIHRTGSMVNSLGACCLLLLVYRPSDLFDPSFQLTVVSVAAIVCMAFPLIEKMRGIGEWMPSAEEPFPPNVSPRLRRFCEKLYWRQRIWDINVSRQIWSAAIKKSLPSGSARDGGRPISAYIFEGFLVSAIVQFWLLPFLAVYFHRFTPAAVFFNIWAGFIIAIESFAALTAIAFAAVSVNLAAPFILIAESANWLLVAIPGIFVEHGFGGIRMPVHSDSMRFVYILYFLPVVVLAAAVHRWNPFALKKSRRRSIRAVAITAAAAVVLVAAVIFHPFAEPSSDGLLRVAFLDVGQGDSAFVTFPNGDTMLIDAGGRFDFRGDDEIFEPDIARIGEAVVSEFIWAKGYSSVDTIVATHADADHVRGLEDIAKNFRVGLAIADPAAKDSEASELFAVLDKQKIPVAHPNGRYEIGGAVVEFLYPDTDVPIDFSDNNRSVVLKITFGTRVFLFTGDIEMAAEQRLLAAGVPLTADVVKVPHHGSRTSSTQAFINAVDADFAVIPVGKRSIFGHPHTEVVERWATSGANVMRTGENGTITFTTNGEMLSVDVFYK